MRGFVFIFVAVPLLMASCVKPRPEPSPSGRKKAAEKTCKAKEAVGFHLHTTMQKITWPLDEATGRYPIRVCWNDWAMGDRVFPVAEFAPNLQEILPIRKKWVQEIVEKEWNGRTNIRFIGWKSCKESPDADVILQPMSSRVVPDSCGSSGQSCVNTIGKNNGTPKSKMVYLNMLFGDEFLYASRYSQSTAARGGWDAKKSLGAWWIPQACGDNFTTPWSTVNANASPDKRIDINLPDNMNRFRQIYQGCLQTNALHEFGHIAGFLHEQLRRDNSATESDYQSCLDYITKNKIGANQDKARQAQPIGMLLSPFDKGSIMSYCREDAKPVLTDLDLKGTLVAYPNPVKKPVETPTPLPIPLPIPLPNPMPPIAQKPVLEPLEEDPYSTPVLSSMEPEKLVKSSNQELDCE